MAFAALPVQASDDALETSVRELASSIAERPEAGQIRKVAVLEFPDLNGYPSALGPFLAEELVTRLFLVAPDDFDVVERSQLRVPNHGPRT